MKILRVIKSTDLASGGPIESLIKRSSALRREGHEIEVVSLDDPLEAASRDFPFRLTALGRGVTRYGFNWKLARWIRKNAARFDIVILHGVWNYTSFGAWLALRKLSIPYVIFTHGMLDPWFREHYPLKHVFKQIYWWLAEGKVLRDAERVFFTADEERVRAQGVFHGFQYREQVVRYGTSDPIGDPETERSAFYAQIPQLKNKRFLLFVSRLHPKKGCDMLIDAFASCLDQIPADVDLVMAGPDQVGWMKELKAFALTAGVEGRIHWPGMIRDSIKWGALRSADALILPSHQENFGIVVAEAMACSTPVLISNKVNIWREVQESGAGIVEEDTADGTRNLIEQFYRLSEADRSVYRANARSGFQRHFDITRVSEDLIRALGNKIQNPQRKPASGWRILHVIRSTAAATGGPIEWLARLSEALESAGHEIEIVSLEDTAQATNHRLRFRNTALGKGIGKYGFNSELQTWMRTNANRFDMVILHGLWNYSSLGAWRGLRGSRTPYVIFPHGMMDPWFRDQYPLKHIKKYVYWKLAEKRVLRDACRTIFTCEEEKDRAKGVFGRQQYREHVVRLGTVDPSGNAAMQREAFYKSFPGLKGRRFLLFLSRIHLKKGCDLLLDAFAQTIKQLPDDLDLVIAGPDQEGLVPRLQQIAQRHAVQSRVHWPGMIDGDAKWGAFRSAEVFALPSHQENFGFVVAESMACGTPVLISDKINIWREVLNSGGGLVDTDTVEGMARLIRRYFQMSETERTRMRSSAREGYLTYFNIAKAADELIGTIDEVLRETHHIPAASAVELHSA